MKRKYRSYLSKLKFDPKLSNTIHARYISNIRIVLLLIFTILAVGITSLFVVPRRLDPEIKLTIVSVTTLLPGAGPSDIESLITIPLENKLNGVKGLDTMTSLSQDNVSIITMQFIGGVDKDKARNDIQSSVAEVTGLPIDAKTPKIEAFDFENQPIWQFTVTSKSDTASLMRFSDTLKEEIKRLPQVDHVDLNGFEEQEIQVIVNQEKIKNYGINPMQVSTAIKTITQSYPAGRIDTGSSSFTLAIDTHAVTIEDIRNMHINVSGNVLKLGDIAEVFEKSKIGGLKSFYADPNSPVSPAITFSVFKSSSSDIDKAILAVEKKVNGIISKSGGLYHISTITNTGEDLNKQFTDLLGEFQSTLILVFINLLLFLGIRQALIASMTIPLTFLMAFGWMGILGQTINFVSLFALLLAFGTSIDDTIVTVSAMTTYYRTGKFTPYETGILVWRDFIVPIWTTTVTTVWAFLPLILSTGIIGEFIKPIPVVVATTMYTSTAVTWFITLPMMIVLLNPNLPKRVKLLLKIGGIILSFIFLFIFTGKNIILFPIILTYVILLLVTFKTKETLFKKLSYFVRKNKPAGKSISFFKNILTHGVINTDRLSKKYQHIIIRIISSKRGRMVAIVSLISFALSAYLLIPLGLVKNEFFPKANTDTLYVTLEMSSGTNLYRLNSETEILLNELKTTRETKGVVAQVGRSIGGGFGPAGSPNSSLITLMLIPKEKRKTGSSDIALELRKKYTGYTRGKVTVKEISGGPPAGSDIQIKLLGDDLNTLDGFADKISDYLSNQAGVINIDKSVKAGTSKLAFVPDRIKLAQNGLTIDSLGFWLRTSASGFTLNSVRFNNKDEDVVFYVEDKIPSPETLGQISIPSPNGPIPLLSLGLVELKTNPTIITREGGKRTISVSAGVLKGYSVSETNKKLEQYAATNLSLPDGYEWKTGGVNEENQKSVNSIFRAMGLSFILIMATMVIEFQSYRQAAIILALIPFAVSGVFVIFGLTGTPLSFPALIGVMALFGVVVTNAMFIVEKINQNRKGGMKLKEAIGDAAQGRLEPIMLTSLTSILGLIPITLANPLWRGLGGAIIAGLLFSGLIMLLFIPVTYYLIYRSKE